MATDLCGSLAQPDRRSARRAKTSRSSTSFGHCASSVATSVEPRKHSAWNAPTSTGNSTLTEFGEKVSDPLIARFRDIANARFGLDEIARSRNREISQNAPGKPGDRPYGVIV